MFVKVALQSLISKIDKQLLKRIGVEDFESLNVQQVDFEVFGKCFIVRFDLFINPRYDITK
jgi:hypothetical protein